MKLVAAFTAAMATLTTTVSGQFARVENRCNFPAYVQSVPYDGSASGTLTQLQPRQIFAEPYRASGSTVKMGTQGALAAPLFFGYSGDARFVYYDLNSRFGNPFKNQRVRQDASRPFCPAKNCAPGQAGCYGNAQNGMVAACAKPTNVTVTLCAAA